MRPSRADNSAMSSDTTPHPCNRLRLRNALHREFATNLIHPDWPAPARVQAATTTRQGPEPTQRSTYGFNVGLRCGDEPLAVARNRAFLRDALALPSGPRWLRQVHGTRAVVVDAVRPPDIALPDPPPLARVEGEREPEADAAVTRTPGVVLAIQTADCLPVLLCADDGAEVGAAHAGWRGLAAGVLEAVLAAMQASPGHVLAWLGPAIGAASYEVGTEVRDAFVACDRNAECAFVPTRPGHWTCDLYALARQRLGAAGVGRIFGGAFDTFTDTRLHSFRRDGSASGRMVSLVWFDA